MLSTLGRSAVRRICGGASTSTNRTLQSLWGIQRVESPNCAEPTSSRVSWARVARFYATASETVAKPKAPRAKKTTTATKKTTTKAKSAATAKKATPAKKKPVKKKKKVVAKKPPTKKRVKKIPTDEEKLKAQIKELKIKALLKDEPSSGANTAWKVMLLENTKSGDGVQVSSSTPGIAARYRSSSPAELEALNHKANENKAAAQSAHKQWVESHTVKQIVEANSARRLLRRKTKTTTKYTLLTDDRIPKRPRSAWVYFVADRHGSGDLHNVGKLADKTKLVLEEWNSASEAEKKPYLEKAAADTRRYQQEFKTVFGKESTSKATPA